MTTLLIVFVCLLLNAILSGAEMAFVTVDKRLLRNQALGGNRKAIYLETMQASPERILSVVQIGITLVGAISAAVSGAGAEEHLSPWLMNHFPMGQHTSVTVSIIMVVLPLTILSVVIGELAPKSFAIRYSFKICMYLTPSLKLAERILGFMVTPMEKATAFFVSLFLPKKSRVTQQEVHTEVSLEGLRQDHKQYVQNLIDLDAKIVTSIMVAWGEVETATSYATSDEIYNMELLHGHSRLPIIDHGEVYGFLHLKDFLRIQKLGQGENWLSFIRPPLFVQPNTKLLTALRLMKKHKVQILFVGTSEKPLGILTMEDLIEEIVGDIEDENEDKRFVGFLRQRIMHNREMKTKGANPSHNIPPT